MINYPFILVIYTLCFILQMYNVKKDYYEDNLERKFDSILLCILIFLIMRTLSRFFDQTANCSILNFNSISIKDSLDTFLTLSPMGFQTALTYFRYLLGKRFIKNKLDDLKKINDVYDRTIAGSIQK